MKIIQPSTKEEWDKYYDLRFEVLREPWNQLYASTKDELETTTIHLLVTGDDNEGIGTGRLQINSADEAQIRSMAIHSDWQKKGIGSTIVRHIEQTAKKMGEKYIVLDARENAVKFYEKLGYRVTGKSYLLFGIIQHYKMRKKFVE